MPLSGVEFHVGSDPVLRELDITDVELVKVDLGLVLLFKFTPEASRSLYRITAGSLGKRLLLKINGNPIGVRIINKPSGDGTWMTFTELSDEALTELVLSLRETTAKIRAKLKG